MLKKILFYILYTILLVTILADAADFGRVFPGERFIHQNTSHTYVANCQCNYTNNITWNDTCLIVDDDINTTYCNLTAGITNICFNTFVPPPVLIPFNLTIEEGMEWIKVSWQ